MMRYLDYSNIEAELYGEIDIPENHKYEISVWTKPLNSDQEKENNLRKMSF